MDNDVSLENSSVATSSFITVNNTFDIAVDEMDNMVYNSSFTSYGYQNDDNKTNEQNSEKKLLESMAREMILTRRVQELELESEIKNNNAKLDQNKQLQNTLADLIAAHEKINQMYATQRELNAQIDALQANLKEASDKYTEAVSVKTSTTQTYAKCEERLGIVDCQLVILTTERDEAIATLDKLQNENEAARLLHDQEKHDLEQRLNDLIAQNTTELASSKQQKVEIESRLATLQTENQLISDEKKKLVDDNQAINLDNKKMSNELVELKPLLEQSDGEIKKIAGKLNAKQTLIGEIKNKEIQIRKIAIRYKNLFGDLQTKYEALEAEKAAQIKTQDEAFSKQLCELDAKHASTMKTLQSMIEEKKQVSSELTATKTQLVNSEQVRIEIDHLKSQMENRVNDLTDENKKNEEEIARLKSENRVLRLKQLPKVQSGAKPTKLTKDAHTKNAKPIAGMFQMK